MGKRTLTVAIGDQQGRHFTNLNLIEKGIIFDCPQTN